VFKRGQALGALALLAAGLTLAAQTVSASAATREPLARIIHPPRIAAFGYGRPRLRPDARALRAMARASSRRFAGAGGELQITSSHYGPAAIASVARTLRSLDHGPEMSTLSVYVATPAEIRRTCGAGVVACYVPGESKMVVSGVDRPVAGVPRAFAIAHEYGHHIANSETADAQPALEAGTIRWATYERVCQLTRAGRLYPGNQGAHYWEDPEEAFAQSFADLNRPAAGVSWQYTPLLQPTSAALAKIHADIAHPWSGPLTRTWSAAPTPGSPVTRRIRTPLDGKVSIALQSAPGAALRLTLRDPERNRVVAHAATNPEGTASLSYDNCGHPAFTLEVRGATRPTGFQAAITRP